MGGRGRKGRTRREKEKRAVEKICRDTKKAEKTDEGRKEVRQGVRKSGRGGSGEFSHNKENR